MSIVINLTPIPLYLCFIKQPIIQAGKVTEKSAITTINTKPINAPTKLTSGLDSPDDEDETNTGAMTIRKKVTTDAKRQKRSCSPHASLTLRINLVYIGFDFIISIKHI
ncbi:hypothetical protein WJU23_16195 [Prosthecobacter sp. SYSU 5D2]|uniref:hypothetical protein n=1 Tax=Prosthecobacter sp. SYSU 5D2 TaxID=3134134 RepID=UPI0031FE7D8A